MSEELIPKLDHIPISASRVKTFSACSWLYFQKYINHVPEPVNEGAQRGTICHSIFELLLSPKHRKNYDLITAADSLSGAPSIARLVRLYIKKSKLPSQSYDQIERMILVGLKNDFFVKDAELVKAEYAFDILNEKPRYFIKGFIDKLFIRDDTIIIDDFKSSKRMFEGEEKLSNLQALIYSLACKKIWPKLKSLVRFIFLQYPDNPMMPVSFTDDQLKGLEYYLAEIQKKLDSFTEDNARSNLAANQQIPSDGSFSGRLLCGFAKKPNELKKDGTKKWHCPFKFSFNYYVLKKDGKTVKSFLKKEDAPKDVINQLETIHCPPCPCYQESTPEPQPSEIF